MCRKVQKELKKLNENVMCKEEKSGHWAGKKNGTITRVRVLFDGKLWFFKKKRLPDKTI